MQEVEEETLTQSGTNEVLRSHAKFVAVKKERSKAMLSDLYNKCTFLAVDKGRYLTTNIKFLPKEKLHSLDMRFISSEISLTNTFRPKGTDEHTIASRKLSVESVITNNKKIQSTFFSL